MAAINQKLEYLVDPELIIPDSAHETDEDFWYRMCLVPDFAPFVVLGPYTRNSFELFIENALDGIYMQVSTFLAKPDVYSLYAQLDQLPDCTISSIGRTVDFEADHYHPKYGSPENRFAIQYDLNEAATDYILSDAGVWNGDSLGVSQSFEGLSFTDVNKGKSECLRTFIKSNPSFSILHHYAEEAFPNLEFCEETWATTRKFVGEERENALIMANYLEALNDHALDVWKNNDDNHRRISQMGGFHVVCSPENGLTDNNNKRIAERRYHHDDETFEMDWHAKLFPNRNRFYFVVDTTDERIVIGGCTEHYQTR